MGRVVDERTRARVLDGDVAAGDSAGGIGCSLVVLHDRLFWLGGHSEADGFRRPKRGVRGARRCAKVCDACESVRRCARCARRARRARRTQHTAKADQEALAWRPRTKRALPRSQTNGRRPWDGGGARRRRPGIVPWRLRMIPTAATPHAASRWRLRRMPGQLMCCCHPPPRSPLRTPLCYARFCCFGTGAAHGRTGLHRLRLRLLVPLLRGNVLLQRTGH